MAEFYVGMRKLPTEADQEAMATMPDTDLPDLVEALHARFGPIVDGETDEERARTVPELHQAIAEMLVNSLKDMTDKHVADRDAAAAKQNAKKIGLTLQVG